MRTTVTIDPDVEELLRNAAHEGRTSFKRVLNNAVRVALGSKVRAKGEMFEVEPQQMGLRRGFDPVGMHDIEADLEAEAFLDLTRKLEVADGER